MDFARLWRHGTLTHWRTRLLFPQASLAAIEAAVVRAEQGHTGQIRFAIETALPPRRLLGNQSARDRAIEVFANLRVWDTEHNNGILIYVLLADRTVEIVADRGISAWVGAAEWQAVCKLMETEFRAGRFQTGAVAGVDAAGALMMRHFGMRGARVTDSLNELPDQPALL